MRLPCPCKPFLNETLKNVLSSHLNCKGRHRLAPLNGFKRSVRQSQGYLKDPSDGRPHMSVITPKCSESIRRVRGRFDKLAGY